MTDTLTLDQIAERLQEVADGMADQIGLARTIGEVARRTEALDRVHRQIRHIRDRTTTPLRASTWLRTAFALSDGWKITDLDRLHADRADRRGL